MNAPPAEQAVSGSPNDGGAGVLPVPWGRSENSPALQCRAWSLYIFTRRVRAEARTHMVERVSTKHVGPGFSPAWNGRAFSNRAAIGGGLPECELQALQPLHGGSPRLLRNRFVDIAPLRNPEVQGCINLRTIKALLYGGGNRPPIHRRFSIPRRREGDLPVWRTRHIG